MDIFDKHAPMKSKRVKHETQHEWINDEIKMAIKIVTLITNAKTGNSTNFGVTKLLLL